MIQILKCGNGIVISYYTLLGMCLLIYTGIKVSKLIHVNKRGLRWRRVEGEQRKHPIWYVHYLKLYPLKGLLVYLSRLPFALELPWEAVFCYKSCKHKRRNY